MNTPYFYRKQRQSAEIVVWEELPGHRVKFSAWKVMRAWWHTVIVPEFIDTDPNVLRHLADAIGMMMNHAGFAMHREFGAGNFTAESLGNRLMSQADPEHGDICGIRFN